MSIEQPVITNKATLIFLYLKLGCHFISFRTSDTATRYVRYHIVSNEDPVLSEVAAREHAITTYYHLDNSVELLAHM